MTDVDRVLESDEEVFDLLEDACVREACSEPEKRSGVYSAGKGVATEKSFGLRKGFWISLRKLRIRFLALSSLVLRI